VLKIYEIHRTVKMMKRNIRRYRRDSAAERYSWTGKW